MSQEHYYSSRYQISGNQVNTKKLSVKSSKKVHTNTLAAIQSGKSLPKWNDYANGPDSNLIKIVVIGDSGAGKSNLIQQLTDQKFDSRSKSTIGIDFAMYEFEEPPGIRRTGKHDSKIMHKAQVWDTAGQER